MIKELQLFLNALERAEEEKDPHIYIQHLKIEPMSKPAYKRLTLAVHKMDDNKKVYSISKVYRITDDDEKNKACLDIAEELIVVILKNISYEAS